MIESFLTGFLFMALGLFVYVKPGLVWKFTERWKSYYMDEPSQLYIKSTKLGGVLLMIFGLAVMVLPLITGE